MNGRLSYFALLLPVLWGCSEPTADEPPVTQGAGGSMVTGGSSSGGSVSGGAGGTLGATGGLGPSLTGGANTGGASLTGGASTGGQASNGTGGNVAGASGGAGSGAGGSVGGSVGDTGGTGGTDMEPPCEVDHGDEIPSLKEKYASLFEMGAAIDTQYQNYEALLSKHFSSVTAEDQMKFDALQPTEGNFSYATADQMVNFAVSQGMQVRGHALVWHRQTPAWVFNGSREQVLARMRNHINNVMEHFQGRVQIWDVVNEAIMDDGSYRTNTEESGQESGWYGALQEEYIAEAFIAARAADPEARLFYNDYYNYHPVRRDAIFNMLQGLLEAGVPVDGVGLQAHLNLEPGTNPEEQSYYQTVENLETAIEMYASLGLDVQVTEMDLSLYLRGVTYTPEDYYEPEDVTPAILEQQAERYREFFDMFRKHADVISSVSLWGIVDSNTWLSEFDSGRQDFPLLFDANQEPKPAFWAVVDFCQ